MANKGLVESYLNQLDAAVKRVLVPAFRHTLDTFRLGDNAKATNFSWYKFQSTTATVANTEFSIQHGLNQAPSKLVQVLDLNAVNSQHVNLTVTRAPDGQRVYLSSPSTSAVLTVYLEV